MEVEQTLDEAHWKQIDGDDDDSSSSRLIDSADKWGYTALIEASMWGHVEVVNFLLERGASVSKPSLAGETALHWASMNGHLHVVKILLYRGKADPNVVTTRRKRTPLHMAAEKGHLEVINMLMKAGCSVSFRDVKGRTPLDDAENAGEKECVVVLSENRKTTEKRVQLKFFEKKIQVSFFFLLRCCCCLMVMVLLLSQLKFFYGIMALTFIEFFASSVSLFFIIPINNNTW